MHISQKDLLYLSDELAWEMLAMKKCHHAIQEVSCSQIKQTLTQIGQTHQQHYETLLMQLHHNATQPQ